MILRESRIHMVRKKMGRPPKDPSRTNKLTIVMPPALLRRINAGAAAAGYAHSTAEWARRVLNRAARRARLAKKKRAISTAP